MTPTEQDFINAIRREVKLGPDPDTLDWAALKLVSDRLGILSSNRFANGTPIVAAPQAAILVGHTAGTGAYATDGQEENLFNTPIAIDIIEKLDKFGVKAIMVERKEEGYKEAMKHYAKVLNAIPTIRAAVELHFNSGPPSAHGFEHIYTGSGGRVLATSLNAAHNSRFFWQRNRGIKRPFMGRGATFLNSLKAAACIIEPAFGSNLIEWERFKEERDAHSSSVALGITDYLRLTA